MDNNNNRMITLMVVVVIALSLLLSAAFFMALQSRTKAASILGGIPSSEDIRKKIEQNLPGSHTTSHSPPNHDKGKNISSLNRGGDQASLKKIPIATSGTNVYLVWPSNKTGNSEVMFRASIDGGKTFGNKINLSNSSKNESVNVQIAAAGNNAYVTWWEHNATSNEPVMRVSNDNGKTFGPPLMLTSDTTTSTAK